MRALFTIGYYGVFLTIILRVNLWLQMVTSLDSMTSSQRWQTFLVSSLVILLGTLISEVHDSERAYGQGLRADLIDNLFGKKGGQK